MRSWLILCVVALTSVAHANLTHTCFFVDGVDSGTGFGSSDPSVPWFAQGATVDVYYSTENVPGVFNYRPYEAVGVTETQFQQVVIKAVGIWNEQSGAKLRLRYRGAYTGSSITCNQSLGQQCAIVITGDQLSCPATWTAASFPGLDTSHKFKQGNIAFYTANQDGMPCHTIPWTLTTSGGYVDLVRTLVHELGHTAFAMGHPTDLSTTSDCTQYDPNGNALFSVMSGNGEHDGRNLKAWDREVAQLRYGSRATTAQQWKAALYSTSTWFAYQTTGTSSTHPLFRPDSETAGLSTRMIAWSDGSSTVGAFGQGLLTAAKYAGGLTNVYNSLPYVDEPVALASQGQSYTSPIVLLAYKKDQASSDGYDNDRKQICYTTSSNYGSSWASESCSTTSQTSSVYGVTASYSDSASSFVIPWINTVGVGYTISILVVPVFGFATNTTLSISSPMQPAIACKTGTNTCLVVYAVDDTGGSLGWFTITIDTTTKAVTASTPSSSTAVVDENPGLAWDADNNAYRLARAEKSSAIYSYILGTGWTGTGDIYNNSGGTTQISGAALSTRYFYPLLTRPYGFFEIYF